jgi:hypothetical protein
MKVRELIEQLIKVNNLEAEIVLQGNIGNPEDEDDDVYFEFVELWDDGEDSITMFVGGAKHQTLES